MALLKSRFQCDGRDKNPLKKKKKKKGGGGEYARANRVTGAAMPTLA